MKEDAWEMQNLYENPAYKDVLYELTTELLMWLVRTTRVKTINPSVLTSYGVDGDWDIGQEFIADDGCVKNSYIAHMVERGAINYY